MRHDFLVFTPSDGLILHALQLNPRVSFRRIAAVTGISEQTVSRRYQQLRRDGVLRVVGSINPQSRGDAQWVARLRVKPDRIGPLARALSQRPDVGYASIQSGGSELLCIISAPHASAREEPLLQRLPRSPAVIDLSLELMLHAFGELTTTVWTAYGDTLSPDQVRRVGGAVASDAAGDAVTPTVDDRRLLDELALDGRASHAQLARATGWSVARVVRRLTALESSGALRFDVDILPERMGYHVNAVLWMTVAPHHVEEVGATLASHDAIAFVGAVTGRHNLMAVAICRDTEDLYGYVTRELAATGLVGSCDISVRAQLLKQSTSLIAHGRLIPQ